jgi:nitrate reductase NapD
MPRTEAFVDNIRGRLAEGRAEEDRAVIISGIVMACRPEHLAEVSQAMETIPWAEVHFSDPRGRLVVTIEAADLDQSVDRLKQLQALPRVLMAELAQYCIEEELRDQETVGRDARGDALFLPPVDPKSR